MKTPKDPQQWERLFDVIPRDFSQPGPNGTCIAGRLTEPGQQGVIYPDPPEAPRFDAGAFQRDYYRRFSRWPSIAMQNAERRRVEGGTQGE